MTDLPYPPVRNALRTAEWPTLAVAVTTYAIWGAATLWLPHFSIVLAMVLCALAAALHSSLSHEALHGHPFRNPTLNAILVFPALSVTVPYLRFRDTHLAHHHDESLTDPYDDPETNYFDPKVWNTLPTWRKTLHRWNNTLAGRLLLGPAIGQITFMRGDWQRIRAGDRRVLMAWLMHIPAVTVVFWWMISVAALPLWAWAVSVYAGFSILKLRTFLEHQAHPDAQARTAIVEDRGLFAFLFLNNNLHVVHHQHPGLPWYALPERYAARRDSYLESNGHYRYDTYAEVLRKHLFRAKDPVPHPFYGDGHDH